MSTGFQGLLAFFVLTIRRGFNFSTIDVSNQHLSFLEGIHCLRMQASLSRHLVVLRIAVLLH